MYLKRLTIHTLPGIEPGFDFAPAGHGVNIITGPNAIGKSSLERALGYLLRGARKEDPLALSLEAELVGGDTIWRVQRNGSQIIWYRDGSVAAPPALPGASHTGLYRLSVEHLLVADDVHDKELARSLRNSLLGNFDLEAPRLDLGPRFAQTEEKKLLEAHNKLRQTERDYDALERELEQLPRLDEQIDAAESAQRRREGLQHGVDLSVAMATVKKCAGALDVFPAGMDKLRGNELERLGSLEKNRNDLQETLREQQRRLARAEAMLTRTGLQQKKPDQASLDATDQSLRQLGQKLERRGHLREQLARAGAALNQARTCFNEAGAPPALDVSGFKQAEEIAAPLIKAQTRRDELKQQLEQAVAAPDEAEIDNLNDAGKALRKWLAAVAVEQVLRAPPLQRWLHYFLCALLATGVILLLVVPGVLKIVCGIVVAVTFTAVAWYWLILRRARLVVGFAARQAREDFTRTGIDPPREWFEKVVERYLREEIDRRHGELILQRERALQLANVRPELDRAEAQVERLQAARREASQALGFDPTLPGISPDLFLQQCRQLAEAENRHAEEQARLDNVTREIATDLAGVRAFLAEWCGADAPASGAGHEDRDVNELQSLFQQLQARARQAQDAENDITRCREAIDSSQQGLKANRNDVENLFAGCGLEPDARTQLEQGLDRLPEWQAKRKELESAELEEQRLRALLAAYPDVIERVEAGRLTDLQNDLAGAAQQAGEYTRLIERRAAMKSRLDQAGADRRLSRDRAAADAARDALEDKREHSWLAAATGLLLDNVEQTYQAQHVPPTLSRAQALFNFITHHAFDLHLEKNGTFSAQDLRQNAHRSLGELSSGTRMQLLLALRLAWIGAQEQGGETLPLFLDEALTTSDEDRFAAMASSLERLAAGEARQIFYLSARRHECALWQRATGNGPPVIDLAAVRFPQGQRPRQDYELALPPSLPSPEGREVEDYAAVLGVPRLDPRLAVGSAHLFYLMRDDPGLLHQLMDSWRITSLAQLESLLHSDAAGAAVAADGLRGRLQRRCQVVRTWTSLWRRGRGKPVNRIALEQSDAISDRFMDRVAKLAESINEDGKALLKALREGQVSGFRTGKIEELERWLLAEGYTEQEAMLPAAERWRLTLQLAMANPDADADDVNRVINWLESALNSSHTIPV